MWRIFTLANKMLAVTLLPRISLPPTWVNRRRKPPSLARGARVDWSSLTTVHYTRRGWVKKRILFVEDEADFRETFAHALEEALAPERLDVAFVEAGTVAEARDRLREDGLDAALIDITLPDGNGLELLEEINSDG